MQSLLSIREQLRVAAALRIPIELTPDEARRLGEDLDRLREKAILERPGAAQYVVDEKGRPAIPCAHQAQGEANANEPRP